MNPISGNKILSVLLMSLVILANAQRTSNNYRDVGVHELERQNKITKQILEAFIQKKLGLRNNSYRAPSLLDILPMPTPSMVTLKQLDPVEEPEEEVENIENQESVESQEFNDSDSLQSVESEQIDSIYNNEGRSKKYVTGPPFEADLETSGYNRKLYNF